MNSYLEVLDIYSYRAQSVRNSQTIGWFCAVRSS